MPMKKTIKRIAANWRRLIRQGLQQVMTLKPGSHLEDSVLSVHCISTVC